MVLKVARGQDKLRLQRECKGKPATHTGSSQQPRYPMGHVNHMLSAALVPASRVIALYLAR